MIRIGFFNSLVSSGVATTAILQTSHLAGDFKNKLIQAITSITENFKSLQRQMNSLARVIL